MSMCTFEFEKQLVLALRFNNIKSGVYIEIPDNRPARKLIEEFTIGCNCFQCKTIEKYQGYKFPNYIIEKKLLLLKHYPQGSVHV